MSKRVGRTPVTNIPLQQFVIGDLPFIRLEVDRFPEAHRVAICHKDVVETIIDTLLQCFGKVSVADIVDSDDVRAKLWQAIKFASADINSGNAPMCLRQYAKIVSETADHAVVVCTPTIITHHDVEESSANIHVTQPWRLATINPLTLEDINNKPLSEIIRTEVN